MIVFFRGNEGCLCYQVPNVIVGLGCESEGEIRWILAVSMTSAAVVAYFPRSKLVPSLRGIEDHSSLVDCLESKGRVGGNLGHETSIGIAVGIL